MSQIIIFISQILIYPLAYGIMLTSQIILWALSGGNHKINLDMSKMLEEANIDQEDGPAMSMDHAVPFILFFRFPFILGTAFWIIVIFAFYYWLNN